MRGAVLLGLRLTVGNRGQRTRMLLAVAASAIGSAVLLLVSGVAHAGVLDTTAFSAQEVGLLVAGTIGMVALPVLVLVATVARLSAGVRDRRLANLRLLGLSRSQTRAVAATEVGVATAAGAVAGGVVLLVLLASLAPDLVAPPVAWPAVLLGVTAAGVLTAALPARLSATQSIAQVRRSADAGPSLLRVVPLLVGLALCWSTRSPLVDRGSSLPPVEVAAIIAGIALLAVGILLVVPVLVALIARAVLLLARGPLATLTGRRLQSQPAAVTRVIAALAIGLFVVTAARGVLVAFQSTPQYLSAAQFVEHDQTAEVSVAPEDLAVTEATLRGLDGVRRIDDLATLRAEPLGVEHDPLDSAVVVVATCAQLAGPSGRLPGCSDEGVSQVGDPWFVREEVTRLRLTTAHPDNDVVPGEPSVVVDSRGATTIDPDEFSRVVGALEYTSVVVVPPDTPGLAPLLVDSNRLLVAHAGPGRQLYDEAEAAGLLLGSYVDLDNYDFVQGMRALLWTLAAVVLAIGLLTATVAGVDRALARRRELTALRLIGTPGRLLRRSQWLEAALPTALGTLLAIVAGTYAGATYLQLDDDRLMPMSTAFLLAGVAVVSSALLAGVTVIGTTPRLRAEHIRAE